MVVGTEEHGVVLHRVVMKAFPQIQRGDTAALQQGQMMIQIAVDIGNLAERHLVVVAADLLRYLNIEKRSAAFLACVRKADHAVGD